MTAQRSITGLDEPERDHERERDHEHFPTPPLLVEAVLARLVHVNAVFKTVTIEGCPQHLPACFSRKRPLRIVDVGCGAGVWASRARKLFTRHGIPVMITGIDNRREVEPLARRWCDEVIIGDLREVLGGEALDGAPVARRWDLLLSNPPFSRVLEVAALGMHCATASIILHTEQSLTRSAAAAAFVEVTPPRFELRLAGSVSFTGKGPDRIILPGSSGKSGSDSRCYSVTTWQAGSSGPWPTTVMRLPVGARSWRVRPGEEPASDDLPEAPR
jgi:hypothetical protein